MKSQNIENLTKINEDINSIENECMSINLLMGGSEKEMPLIILENLKNLNEMKLSILFTEKTYLILKEGLRVTDNEIDELILFYKSQDESEQINKLCKKLNSLKLAL